MDGTNGLAFSISQEAFAGAVDVLARYGALDDGTVRSLSMSDPGRWDRIAIACTEFLNVSSVTMRAIPDFQEMRQVLALKLTAEAAIAWRAAEPPVESAVGSRLSTSLT